MDAIKRNVHRRWYTRRPAVIGGMIVGGLVISGSAAAYWTTSGSGTATAATGAGQAVTVTQVGAAPSDLAPGGTAQAVNFKISNPKASPQRIATVTVSIATVNYTGAAGAGNGTTAANHPAGFAAVTCSATDFTLVQPTAINADMASGDTTFNPSGATIAMINSGSNQDDCKNVTVNLAFAAA
jgi:hypothetical protein